MKTRMPHWTTLTMPVAFVLACAALTILGFKLFGAALPLEARGYTVSVPLRHASGLVNGSDVQVSGVRIGRVESVDRDAGRAVAKLEIDPDHAPLRADAGAVPRLKTLLGEAYLEISPGSLDAAEVPEGGSLSPDRVDRPVQLDEFLETFDAPTRRRTQQLFGGLARALRDRGPALNATLGSAEPVSENFASITSSLARQRGQISTLLSSSANVLATLGAESGALQGAIRSTDDVLETTASRSRELAATVQELEPLLEQLTQTSGAVEDATGDLGAAVDALAPSAPWLHRALVQIDEVAPEFRGLFDDLSPLIEAGNAGLPALERTTGPVREGLGELYPSLRELNPALQVLSANRLSPVSFFANLSSTANGTLVMPGGRVANYGRAMITLWNESLVGWTKKLPTNRQNPYIEPGGLQDLADLGFVKAFDCRHTGNPLYLPPLGTGMPPCVEQGPWDFQGESAFYPRPRLAAP